MSLLFLEAFGAMVLLIFIVWWTMFSGRKNGELPDHLKTGPASNAETKAEATPAEPPAKP